MQLAVPRVREDYIWWDSTKQSNWWGAACGGKYDWSTPNRVLVIQDSTDLRESVVFRAGAPPDEVCENLMCALKLLAEVIVPCRCFGRLQEQSRLRMMDGLRRFVTVDNQEAVKIFDWEQDLVVLSMAVPKVEC